MHPILYLLLLLTLVPYPSAAQLKGYENLEYQEISAEEVVESSVIEGPLVIAADSVYSSNLIVSGDATVEGTVEGEITLSDGMLTLPGKSDGHVVLRDAGFLVSGTVWGDLVTIQSDGVVSGEIYGDVLVFGGMLQLDSTALIKGNLTVLDGEFGKDNHAVVRGQTTTVKLGFISKLLERFMRRGWESTEPGEGFNLRKAFDMPLGWAFTLILYTLAYLLALLFITVIRRWHKRAEFMLSRNPWSPWIMVLTGVIYHLVIFGLILVLAITVIGAVLIPFVLLFFLFIASMGTGQASLWVGGKIRKWFKIKGKSRFVTYTLGFVSIYTVSILGVVFSVLGEWARIPGSVLRVLGYWIILLGAILGRGSIIYVIAFPKQVKQALTQEADESEKR
ncbi:hypothetical protein GF359_00540 [candidate division WOR-3 bacterium]|uniref:Polymer-forming cytoskeletal protein n=1 Tax=candidate division WOR-3 bacterium TaxID=2052148 RepID=A0A9D5K7U0_UNCW3|nr:hypothetical protein [candidate division WOR-3 bacterium]MBD3363680.1 hypothetical protein [candidate division WOR-3 bacterium]